MGTFLTTPRMSPALAARVEASVRGRAVRPRKRGAQTRVVIRRVALLALVAGLSVWLVALREEQHDAAESLRRSLLAQHKAYAAGLTDEHRRLPVRAEAWLARLAGPYEGDFIGAQLDHRTALTEALSRPMVYVRGPLQQLATTVGIAQAAEASERDAFLLCLLDPPEDRSEKHLRLRARAALGGGPRAEAMARVGRLHSALVGLPLLLPSWEQRVQTATSKKELSELRATWFAAHVDEAARTAKARVLLVVMDEPKIGREPTEVDGAFPHHARVALVDLESDELLLRVRKFVDPGWLSDESRIHYARGINGCELALELHAEVARVAAP